MAFPHIVILLLTVAAWLAAVYRLRAGAADFGSVMLNIFWSGYNLMGIVIALRVALQKPMLRKLERVAIHEDVEVTVRYKRKYITARMADLPHTDWTGRNSRGGYPVRRQPPCAAVSPDDAGEHEKDHGNFLQKYGSLLQGGKVPGLLCRAHISGDGADPAHSFFRYSAGLSPTSFLNFLWK